MRVTTIVLCILLSQVSASFFDDFNKAFVSVESSVGNLFSDVFTDVRTTLGCTILAVKKVLALGGDFHESSDYDEKCGGKKNTKDPTVRENLESYSPTPPILPSTLRHSDSNKKTVTEIISEEVKDSVAKVKDNMLGILENQDTHKKIEQVKKRLQNSTDRLSEIGGLLHKEFDNLTGDVKKVLSKIEIDYVHPTLESVWNDVKILHDIESKETNPNDAAEIKNILNDILKILSSSNESDNLAATEKIDSDKVFSLLNNKFEKMKENAETKKTESIVREPKMPTGNNTLEKEINKVKSTAEVPLTFRDVAKKITSETKNQLSVSNTAVKDLTPANEKESAATTATFISTDETDKEENSELSDYYSLLIIPKDSPALKTAVLEAQELVEQSEQSEMIMTSFFQESETKGTNLFDNPEYFTFNRLLV